MQEDRLSAVHLIIVGRVQGVFYRASTREAAHALGLKGWVRNLPDGSVEAVAEGPEEAVERFVAWCRKGPPGAFVTDVRRTARPATGEYSSFDVIRY